MPKSNLNLVECRRIKDEGVMLSWSDGSKTTLSNKTLRTNCPCALCREARGDESHQSPIAKKKSLLRVVESSSKEELDLKNIWPVGNYALGMEWADGHSTGIYTFLYLAELANEHA